MFFPRFSAQSRMSRMNIILRCLLLLFCISLAWRAETAQAETFSVVPDDLEAVDVYLHTVDVGNLVFNNFGHTAIRVHDRKSGRDLVFNWGMFDFGDPFSFSLRFYRGILVYKLGIYSFRSAERYYQEEGRTVWEDQLNLSPGEKRKLLERLVWNSRPENRPYNYQYFFDNCSTRPRDYIDEALGGSLKQKAIHTYTSETFRDMMYKGYSYNPGMDVLLDIGMNNRLDHPLSLWEKMFHPFALREALMQIEGERGPLIQGTRILAQFQGPASYLDLAYMIIFLGFGLPLCVIGCGLFMHKRWPGYQAFFLRAFALVSLPLVGFGGLVGFLMPLSWAVSGHLDLHHNAQQLLFWPIDGLYLLVLFKILWRGKPVALGPKAWRLFSAYTIAHLIVSLFLPVLRALELITQNVDRPSVYVLPPYLVMLFLIFRSAVQPREALTWTNPLSSETAKPAKTKMPAKVKSKKAVS